MRPTSLEAIQLVHSLIGRLVRELHFEDYPTERTIQFPYRISRTLERCVKRPPCCRVHEDDLERWPLRASTKLPLLEEKRGLRVILRVDEEIQIIVPGERLNEARVASTLATKHLAHRVGEITT